MRRTGLKGDVDREKGRSQSFAFFSQLVTRSKECLTRCRFRPVAFLRPDGKSLSGWNRTRLLEIFVRGRHLSSCSTDKGNKTSLSHPDWRENDGGAAFRELFFSCCVTPAAAVGLRATPVFPSFKPGVLNSHTQWAKIQTWEVAGHIFIEIILLLLCGFSWHLANNKLVHFCY